MYLSVFENEQNSLWTILCPKTPLLIVCQYSLMYIIPFWKLSIIYEYEEWLKDKENDKKLKNCARFNHYPNKFLRDYLTKNIKKWDKEIKIFIPEIKYSTDNAAMIGISSYYKISLDLILID